MRLRFTTILWVLATAYILYGGTIPFRFSNDHGTIARKLAQVRLSPLVSPETGRRVSIPDVVQNVLLFVPFGALGVWAGGTRRGRGSGRIALVTGLAFGLAVTVEGLQLLTRDRTASTADVVADTSGALLAAVAASVSAESGRRALRRLSLGVRDVSAFYAVMVAITLVALSSWVPFDITLDVSTVSAKVHTIMRDAWQTGAVGRDCVAMIQYTLLSVATCAWFAKTGRRHAALVSVLVGLVLSLALGTTQLLIVSRAPGLAGLVLRLAGSIAGAGVWAMGMRAPRAGVWLTLLVCATAGACAMQTIALRAGSGSGLRTPFGATRHGIELVLLSVPVGYCFRRLTIRPELATGAGIVTAMLVVAPIELLLGGSGLTNEWLSAACAAVGAWLGVWAAGRGELMFGQFVDAIQTW